MRLRHLSAAALLILASFVHAAADTCSCSADDGSCSVSFTCPHGCLAYCPSGGCRGVCLGVAYDYLDGSLEDPVTAPTPEGSSVKAEMLPSKRIAIKVIKANGQQVASELTRVTGRKIEFKPYQATRRFDFYYDDAELWVILNHLSGFGALKLDGTDFEKLKRIRRALVGNEKMSVCLSEASVKDVTAYLSFLSGVPLSVASGDDAARVTVSLKQATLSEIIDGVSARAGVRIAAAGVPPPQVESGRDTFLSIFLPLILTIILS